MEFDIPQHPEDLESPRPGKVFVRTILDVENCNNVDSIIDEVAAAVLDSKNIFETVVSSLVFDNVYSLIKFWSCHGGSVKQRVIELLVSMVQEVNAAVNDAKNVGQTQLETNKEMAIRRTAFKATAYLYAIGVQVADKTSVPVGAEALAGGKKGKSKAKGKKAEADDDDGENGDEGAQDGDATDGSWNWSGFREACVRLLCDLLCVDMRKLWPLGVPEEETIVVVVKSAARVLCNAQAMKDKEVRRAVVELVAIACRRFPSVAATAVVAVAEAVSKHEHVVAVAVDLTELMSCGLTPQGGMPSSVLLSNNDQGGVARGTSTTTIEGLPYGGKYFAPQAAAELLREVGRVNPGGDGSGSGSSGGLKRASAFIMDVSERCPPLVLGNLACLLPHLDSDNATLRSALVTTLGNIVARSYNSATAEAAAKSASAAALASGGDPLAAQQESAEGYKRRRDALLDALADRIHDVHSYTRAASLRAWCGLTSSTAVPMDRFGPIAALAVGRLMDKGSLVRKMAAQLLRTQLEHNPFSAALDPAVLRANLQAVDAWLKVNAPPAVYAEVTGLDAPPSSGSASASSSGAGAGAGAVSQANKARKGLRAIDEDEDEDEEEDAEAQLTEELLADSAAAMEAEAAGVPNSAQNTQQVMITPEVVKHIKARQQLAAAVAFAEAFAGCLPAAVELLGSKTASDVRESIRLLSRARAFRVPGAEGSLARMLVLVWSDEPGVKEEVVETFDALYLRNEALEEDEEGLDAAGEMVAAAPALEAPAPSKAAAAQAEARPKRGSRSKKSLAEDGDDDDNNTVDEDGDGDGDGGARKGGKKAGKGKSKAEAAPAQVKATGKAKKKKVKQATTMDPSQVAENLVDLLTGAPAAVRASLEEVVRECASQDLLPPGLPEALWSFVAQGVEAQQRIRVDVGGCLVGVVKTRDPQLVVSAKSSIAAACTMLGRARSAMALLTMVGTALPTALDTPEALQRLTVILGPPAPTYQVGSALLRASMRSFSFITAEGLMPDLSLVDNALALADYRLARHACVALQRIRGYSVAQPPRKTMAAAAAAEEKKPAAGKGAKARGKAVGVDEEEAEQEEHTRAAMVQRLLTLVAAMISGAWDDGDVECTHWYPAAQAGMDALFAVSAHPLGMCTPLLQKMAGMLLVDDTTAQQAFYKPGISHTRMSRLFFVLGHVALRTLALTEGLASRVKLLRIRAAERAEHNISNSAPAPTAAGKGKKGAPTEPQPAAGGGKDGIEEQLGVSAAEDEKEAELVMLIAEHELAASNIGGLFAPLLQLVVTGHLMMAQQAEQEGQVGSVAADPLTESALLALVKLMAVSSSFCEAHLQLLFTVLAKSPCPSLRSTIAIALGDLAVRFPNLTEPYTSYMYARLRDSDSGVRKSTLMVLTHLILAEQIKVKGNVGEIAVCLNDPDPSVSDLTKMFFTELSKRSGSPIYNMLPDTLSCLSKLANPQAQPAPAATGAGGSALVPAPVAAQAMGNSDTLRALDKDTFKDIVKFLLGFVAKDKQSESLAEKLLHRLMFAETSSGSGSGGAGSAGGVADPATKALWRDVAFCLSQLPLSDKTIRKMAEGVRGYAAALADDDVWESFASMLAKARKMLLSSAAGAGGSGAGAAPSGAPLSKAELREVVDVWEKSLVEARSGSVDDDAALAAAAAVRKRAARVAAVSGIDQAGLAAAALAKASTDAQAAIQAEKDAVEASKKGRGRGKAVVHAPAVPAASASSRGGAGSRKASLASDDEEEDVPVVAKKGKAAAPVLAAGRKKKGLVVDSDED